MQDQAKTLAHGLSIPQRTDPMVELEWLRAYVGGLLGDGAPGRYDPAESIHARLGRIEGKIAQLLQRGGR